MLKHLATFMALVVLKVRPQMLPHRLMRHVLLVADCAFDSEVLPVIEQVKSKLVFRVEVSSTVVAGVVFW
jgi:hypothetical protein